MNPSGVAVLLSHSISGGGGGSFLLRDTFSGASKDTALWDSTTRPPGWNSGTTIGGSDSEGSNIVTITPTNGAGAERCQGRSSVTLTFDASGKELWLWVTAVPTASNQSSDLSFGLCHSSNRGSINARWNIVNNFGTMLLETNFNNFGGGSQFSTTHSLTTHAWIGLIDTGTDLQFWTATDSAGAPGTRTQRHSILTGGGSYFTPDSVDVGFWCTANNANACPYSASELYLTA